MHPKAGRCTPFLREALREKDGLRTCSCTLPVQMHLGAPESQLTENGGSTCAGSSIQPIREEYLLPASVGEARWTKSKNPAPSVEVGKMC